MNPEVKEKWLKALRSGEYEQTTEALKYENGFCCLGVLTDLYIKEHPEEGGWEISHVKGHYEFKHCSGFLPPKIQEWSGIKSDTGMLPFPINLNREDPKEKIQAADLTKLNDHGASFEEIANIIEKMF